VKQELVNKLKYKYPKILSGTGLCVGDGWYWLLDNLCLSLKFDIANNEYPQIEAIQIKEKFGGLRFYVAGSNSKQQKSIDFACSLSLHICEECGSHKNVSQTSGWIRTLCSKCLSKLKFQNYCYKLKRIFLIDKVIWEFYKFRRRFIK